MGEQIILTNKKNHDFFLLNFFVFFLFSVNLQSTENKVLTDGVWAVPKDPTFQWTLEKVIDCFLPFDPVILEIHGSKGSSSQLLAKQFPRGKIIIYESNIFSYNYDYLDNLYKVDLIRLDNTGYEFLLNNRNLTFFNYATVFSIKIDFSFQNLKVNFYGLKHFLEANGYILLCLWYHEGSEGEAVFIQKPIYNAVFH